MSDPLNPYTQWLELDAEVAPTAQSTPNHYQLLSLTEFESDQQTIVRAADRAQARVRAHRPGGQARLWAELLDQLKQARTTLTDQEQKQSYDAQLREHRQGSASKSAASADTALAAAPDATPAPDLQDAADAPSKSIGHSPPGAWPPGMAPPGSEAPASSAPASPSAPHSEPADVPQPTSPSIPQATPSSDNDPIPLSARWPLPSQSNQSVPPGTAHPEITLPETALPETALPGTAPPETAIPETAPPGDSQPPNPSPPPTAAIGAAPLAVPLSAQQAAAQGPAGGRAAPLATPLTSTACASSAAPDPMAPVATPESQPSQASIPTGTAVAAGANQSESPAAVWSPVGSTAVEENSAPRADGPTPRRKSKSANTSTIVLAVGAVAIMIVLGFVLLGNWGDDNYQQENEVAQNKASNNESTSEEIDLRPMNSAATPRPDKPAQAPAVETPSEQESTSANTPTPPVDMEQPTVEPTPPPSEPAESEPMQPEPEPTEPESPEPEPAETTPPDPEPPAMTPQPEPMPAEPPPVPLTPPTDAEIARLSKLMTTTRNALTDQNLVEAKQAVEQAVQLAKAPAHVAKAQRLQTLVTLVSEFWRAVDESLKGINGGDIITVVSTQVAVVQVTPEVLILRVQGMNKRYPRNDMSEGLAMGLADRWLDQDSEVTPLVRGAFYAIARNQQPDKAKQEFSQAAAKGADVGDLPLVLTDKYDEATLKEEAASAMVAAPPAVAKPAIGTLSDVDKQSLSTALKAARQAMSEGRMADADAQLTIAGNIAEGSELQPVVSRTQELAKHLRGFWNAITTSMESLREGTEITVGSTKVTVVESSPDEITYTLFDEPYTKRRTELPAGLAKAIAKRSLSSDLATSSLQLGAFHAVTPQGKSTHAREAFNEAAAAGANVEQLMLTLDDDYAFE